MRGKIRQSNQHVTSKVIMLNESAFDHLLKSIGTGFYYRHKKGAQ